MPYEPGKKHGNSGVGPDAAVVSNHMKAMNNSAKEKYDIFNYSWFIAKRCVCGFHSIWKFFQSSFTFLTQVLL